jgi:hypothetical protein
MIRRVKALGLATLAVMALGVVAAQGASAAEFNSEVEHTHVTAHTTTIVHRFTVSGFSVECKTSHFTGTTLSATKKTSSVRVHPEYASCEFFEEPATVTTTGCDYVFQAATNGEGRGAVEVVCEGTSQIKVATSSCTMFFGSQKPGGGAKYTTVGSGSTRGVETSAKVTGVKIAKKEGPLCFLLGSEGTYEGGATVNGFNATPETMGAQVGVFYA